MNSDSLVEAAAAASSSIAALARELTVIIPAYNERASLADTIRSLQSQTVSIKAVIVVDDCSTDGTGDVARSMGVVTFGTLLAVLIAVEIGRLIIRPPASFGRAALRLRSGRQSFRQTPPGSPS
jgi:cellulose synthase/poly-beta-1,6-N-acetylglucosamine synthase-like glycosyltransferase